MKKKDFTIDFIAQFKKKYVYTMGGTQIIVLPNGQRFHFDDREFYSGHGTKFNTSIRHHEIGEVLVTESELKAALKKERERINYKKMRNKQEAAMKVRIERAKDEGIYNININEYGKFFELSKEEQYGNFFDAARLAKTLGISQSDAELLKSIGKTYVFAKSTDGHTYELYHPSLDCNHLSISISIATSERIAEFSPEEWQSAPYAAEVGQTSNPNHFVC